MPSASGKNQNAQIQANSSDLLQDPLRNALQVFEKKQRNLEKRKLKLVETKKKAEHGGELNEDQKAALSNLVLVENSLETVRDLHKLVSSLEQEYQKLIKKEQKRVKQEQRDQAESKSRKVGLKILEVQGVLGALTEDVRPDFLAGSNGACLLTEDELSYLDSIYELVNIDDAESEEKKLSVRVSVAGDHLISLVEGKEKNVIEEVTYAQVLAIIDKVVACGYFDKEATVEVEVEEEPDLTPESVETDETPEEPIESPTKTPEETEETPTTQEDDPVNEFEEEATPVTPTTEESVPVNGVDLPPDVQQSPEDEKIDFLGESEVISQAPAEPPSLNPVSPEFIPRNMQGQNDDGWNESDTTTNWVTNIEGGSNDGNWQSVSDSNTHGGNQHGGGNQDNYRGRGGRGGRGFGGRGRGRGNYRGGRQDGGNFNRGGNRGGGNYRGGNRGNRGGPRGGQRGGGPRGVGPRGSSFGRPQNQ